MSDCRVVKCGSPEGEKILSMMQAVGEGEILKVPSAFPGIPGDVELTCLTATPKFCSFSMSVMGVTVGEAQFKMDGGSLTLEVK